MADSDNRWRRERRSGERRVSGDRRKRADRRAADIPLEVDRRKGADRRARERRSGPDRRNEGAWQALQFDAAPTGQFDDAALVAAAVDARERARARYSKFKVGAALETADGAVTSGCNIENATYGLTMCAERVALYKALSEGRDVFTRIAIVADTNDPTPPCGSCRQLLWEYCGDIEIVLANLSDVTRRLRLSQLLPLPFDARLLE